VADARAFAHRVHRIVEATVNARQFAAGGAAATYGARTWAPSR
jgi:hypothetical protein